MAGLGLAAAVLALIGLGDLPLRDFDEATVAQVALELRHGLGEAPLLPTLWGKPYLNKAPGLHSLIALVISTTTQPDQLPSEWTVRLAPAVLSCMVVPLGGWLQWVLRPGDRSSTLATSVILLTLLPVARHGRLAMLDGTQLTTMAVLWLALLQLTGSRYSALWGGVAGLMASAMLLLKAPLLVPAVVAWRLSTGLGLGMEKLEQPRSSPQRNAAGPDPRGRLASLACPHPRGPGALALGRRWCREGSSGCRRRQ